MNKLIIVAVVVMLIVGCAKMNRNPLLTEFDTPFGVPPFEEIKEKHYVPAFKEAIAQQSQEIRLLVGNPDAPTFANTLEVLDRSGSMLRRVSSVFDVLNGSMTNEEMQKIAQELTPMRSKHRDDILLNENLFQRIKTVYEQKDELDLTVEQNTLLDKYYKDFVRGGANLNEEQKAELRKINEELSMLSLKFGENVLKETNKFEMVIEDEKDLAGLPQSVIDAAAETATERGHEGVWVFTIHKPSLIPFIQYADNRELREKLFKAYILQGDNNDELDNKEIITKEVNLRIKKAKILGYKTHAHFVLDKNMAKEPKNVYGLLQGLWKPALKMAKKEAKQMQALINKEGKDFKLQPWDWWYYAEKVKKAKYDLDESQIRPYFKLENVIQGAFTVANKLYGITFEERSDIPKYHEDVKVFEVKDADGSHIGVLYTDYFPRASKRGGAWMNSFRKQQKLADEDIHPVVTNNGNFTKPTGDTPSLLSFDEVLTLFHEFGHGLHGLLSNCTYYRLSGTSVPRDFVELPSQIMENWAADPEVLKIYAKHYETGEPIPQSLINKIKKASKFNQGFAAVEYLAASFLDMDWHTLSQEQDWDPIEFENNSMEKIGLIPEIIVRYRSTYFRHIFSGGYSSGYYSYMWAEVLDADAYQAFKETSLFDRKTAQAFRTNVLEKGGTDDPMKMYKRFRGAEPNEKALLKRKGFL